MTLQITYTAMIIVSALILADKKLSDKVRIATVIVGIIMLVMLIYARLNLPTEVIK